MALEESIADLDRPDAMSTQWPRRLECLASEPPAQEVADVVADDRRADSDHEHEPDLELALAGQDGGRHQRRLPRRGDPHRLQPDDRREQVPEAARDADE